MIFLSLNLVNKAYSSNQEIKNNFYTNIFNYRCHKEDNSNKEYNFYIEESEKEKICLSNKEYKCLLTPSLNLIDNTSTLSNQNINQLTGSSFALKKEKNYLFSIPVSAHTILRKKYILTNRNPFKISHLGYGASLNSDGSCPSFTLNENSLPTFKLEKYVNKNISLDMIYVFKDSVNHVDDLKTAGYVLDETFKVCALEAF